MKSRIPVTPGRWQHIACVYSGRLRIYSQIFLVSSLRGSGAEPTTADSAASGWTDLPNTLLRFILAPVVFDDGMDK